MGNICLSSHNPQEEVCSVKAMINPEKISRPTKTDTQSQSSNITSPEYKRHLGKEDVRNGGIKKIRLLVTKRELQEMVSKRMSVEKMLAEVHREGRFRVEFVRKWKPPLETIPEGSE